MALDMDGRWPSKICRRNHNRRLIALLLPVICLKQTCALETSGRLGLVQRSDLSPSSNEAIGTVFEGSIVCNRSSKALLKNAMANSLAYVIRR